MTSGSIAECRMKDLSLDLATPFEGVCGKDPAYMKASRVRVYCEKRASAEFLRNNSTICALFS